MKTNPNESAFSRPYSHDERPSGGHESDSVETFREQSGLTKREMFSAMALQGYLSSPFHSNKTEVLLSEWSVKAADALITELNKAQ